MSEYEVYYSRYDVEVYDYNGDAVVVTELMDEDEAEKLFNMLSVGAGGEIVLRELRYAKPDFTRYLKTIVRKSKK